MAVLKARRTYKQDIEAKRKALEEALIEGFKKDMTKSKEDGASKAQVEEFGEFLTQAVSKAKPFQFLVDMKKKMDEGVILTENMANAVRKCMEREKQWNTKKDETKKASEAGNYPSITLKVKPFIMKDLNLDSRVITGKVKAESAKAWLIEGHADMMENMSWCVRCGRELKEPASQVTGMGKICADKANVPYDPTDVLSASPAKRKAIRKQFKKKLNDQKFERWIPKSMAEVIDNE